MSPLVVITAVVMGVSIAWWLWDVRHRRARRERALAIVGVGILGSVISWASAVHWLPEWSGSLGLALTAMAGGALIAQPRGAARGN